MNQFNIIELEKDEAFLLSTVMKNTVCPMKCHVPDKRIWWIPKKFIHSTIKNAYYVNIDYSVCHECYVKKNLTEKKYSKDDLVPVLVCGLSFNCDEGNYNNSFKYDIYDISIVDKDTMETLETRIEGDNIIIETNKNYLNIMILLIFKSEEVELLYTCFRKKDPNNISKFGETSKFGDEFMVTIDKYMSSNKVNDIIVKLNNKNDKKEFQLDYFLTGGENDGDIKTIYFTFKKQLNFKDNYKPSNNLLI